MVKRRKINLYVSQLDRKSFKNLRNSRECLRNRCFDLFERKSQYKYDQ
jgi:hypothetical protein